MVSAPVQRLAAPIPSSDSSGRDLRRCRKIPQGLPQGRQLDLRRENHRPGQARQIAAPFALQKGRLCSSLDKTFSPGTASMIRDAALALYMKGFDVTNRFCIAHLIRDIRFLTTMPDRETKAYGKRLLDEVRNMFKVIHGRDDMRAEQFAHALEKAKAKIMAAALKDVPSRLDKAGKELKRQARNMANRFRRHGKEYFEFIATRSIDPTNNVAEQAVRFIVIDRHATQGTRSLTGRKGSERIWTVISTCALQGRSAFNFILQAVTAYFNGTPAPSLIPDTS